MAFVGTATPIWEKGLPRGRFVAANQFGYAQLAELFGKQSTPRRNAERQFPRHARPPPSWPSSMRTDDWEIDTFRRPSEGGVGS